MGKGAEADPRGYGRTIGAYALLTCAIVHAHKRKEFRRKEGAFA